MQNITSAWGALQASGTGATLAKSKLSQATGLDTFGDKAVTETKSGKEAATEPMTLEAQMLDLLLSVIPQAERAPQIEGQTRLSIQAEQPQIKEISPKNIAFAVSLVQQNQQALVQGLNRLTSQTASGRDVMPRLGEEFFAQLQKGIQNVGDIKIGAWNPAGVSNPRDVIQPIGKVSLAAQKFAQAVASTEPQFEQIKAAFSELLATLSTQPVAGKVSGTPDLGQSLIGDELRNKQHLATFARPKPSDVNTASEQVSTSPSARTQTASEATGSSTWREIPNPSLGHPTVADYVTDQDVDASANLQNGEKSDPFTSRESSSRLNEGQRLDIQSLLLKLPDEQGDSKLAIKSLKLLVQEDRKPTVDSLLSRGSSQTRDQLIAGLAADRAPLTARSGLNIPYLGGLEQPDTSVDKVQLPPIVETPQLDLKSLLLKADGKFGEVPQDVPAINDKTLVDGLTSSDDDPVAWNLDEPHLEIKHAQNGQENSIFGSRPELGQTEMKLHVARPNGTGDPREQIHHVDLAETIDRVTELVSMNRPGSITLRLHPEELGTITATVKNVADVFHVMFEASDEHVSKALSHHRGELVTQIESKGQQVGTVQVQTSTLQFNNDQSGQNQQMSRQDFEQSARLNQAVNSGVEQRLEPSATLTRARSNEAVDFTA